MSLPLKDDRIFSAWCDKIDVTSSYRPDETWKFTDTNGHVHRWHSREENGIATRYNAEYHYEIPTTEIVHVPDEDWFTDDGERMQSFGHFCVRCGERIRPGYCPDTHRQYVAGLKHYTIDGVEVPKDQFEQEYRAVLTPQHGEYLTVAQLIERLKQMPLDYPVTYDYDGIDQFVTEIESIEFQSWDDRTVQAVRLS